MILAFFAAKFLKKFIAGAVSRRGSRMISTRCKSIVEARAELLQKLLNDDAVQTDRKAFES